MIEREDGKKTSVYEWLEFRLSLNVALQGIKLTLLLLVLHTSLQRSIT